MTVLNALIYFKAKPFYTSTSFKTIRFVHTYIFKKNFICKKSLFFLNFCPYNFLFIFVLLTLCSATTKKNGKRYNHLAVSTIFLVRNHSAKVTISGLLVSNLMTQALMTVQKEGDYQFTLPDTTADYRIVRKFNN